MRRSLPPPMMMRHPVVGGLIACLMTTLPIAVLAQNAATVSPQGAAATAAQQQQQQAAQQAAQQQAPSAATAARFVQSCNDSLERGVTDLGCQAPLYRNELERLKREALTTQNPQLLSFVGEAYRNPRTGLGDLGQAYRWYLLAAVRGIRWRCSDCRN
ncbi:hypothetical protein [Diaphorobacter aerolatus]|uniref:hypothetical protein n=1 Tax=Diaphorobacter aerolatus TaxID=1288495 RepID=UPI001D01A56A|nr:hypothetical protein [Diaphorobacter aerolatus]